MLLIARPLIGGRANIKSTCDIAWMFIMTAHFVSKSYLWGRGGNRRFLALLRAAEENTQSRALIAAKKVYFGVGGGVDEFLEVFKGVGGGELEVTEQLNIKSEGVGRVVLEIATRSPQ